MKGKIKNELNISYHNNFYDKIFKCFKPGQCDKITDITLKSYGFDVIYVLNGVIKDCEIYWYDFLD